MTKDKEMTTQNTHTGTLTAPKKHQMVIYAAYHLGRCVYVGKSKNSLEKRKKGHYYKCFKRGTRSPNRPFYLYWRSLENSNDLTWRIVESFGFVSKENTRTLEQFYIDKLNPTHNGRNEIKKLI